MATKEDLEKKEGAEESEEQSTEAEADAQAEQTGQTGQTEEEKPADEPSEEKAEEHEEEERAAGPMASPTQLGHRRWVYAAYFAGAIGVAFLASKLIAIGWEQLGKWKPMVGEPREELIMPAAALLGVGLALYYWRRTRARQLAEQVAEELSKVTWPSRTEVTNSTFVVIVTTIVSTVFFALMDRFWAFVTNLVYGT